MFLDVCVEPEVQRIALLDAPSVLGWDAWREVEARHGLGLIRLALQNLIDEGRSRRSRSSRSPTRSSAR